MGLYKSGPAQVTDIETDTAEILAVTDLIPDDGAMTSIAQETTVDSVQSTVDDIEDEVEEIEQHVHNIERWWGAVAVPDETNAIEENVTRPFVAISGNDDWGAAIPILGTADDPVVGAQVEFDPHRILVVDLDDDTSPWRFRLIWGTTTSANAIVAEQCSCTMVVSNAVPGNRAGGDPGRCSYACIACGNETLGAMLERF